MNDINLTDRELLDKFSIELDKDGDWCGTEKKTSSRVWISTSEDKVEKWIIANRWKMIKQFKVFWFGNEGGK